MHPLFQVVPPGHPPLLKKERTKERGMQDPELTKYTVIKLTKEEISTISPAATTGASTVLYCQEERREGAFTGPPPCIATLLKSNNEVATAPSLGYSCYSGERHENPLM